jgi:tRNA dimethylallyltransferase
MDKHQSPIPDPQSSIPDTRFPVVLGVDYPRTVIRKLITTRLHFRLENGMIEEVESLLQNGVTHERMEILGLEYRFISRYLNGVYNKDEMTALLNTAIHQFAKKQMTFFRNMEKNGIKIHWIPEGDFETALEVISKG